jgi:cytoskeleton protein RodZ
VREVGAQLRQARMARGEQIEDVAEHLRIRPTYLYGLEQGDLSIMPGRIYALGFLRSYAQYLGFDGDDLIAQIRSSVADLTAGAHLHRRTPLSESRLPKVPILVVSLAALAGIYAGWAYVDQRSQVEVDLVDEVPDDLQEQTTPSLETVRSPAVLPDAPPAEAAPPATAPMISPSEPAAEPRADGVGPQEPPADPAQAPTASPGADREAAATPPAEAADPDQIAPAEVAAPEPGAGAPDPSAPALPVEPVSDAGQAGLARPDERAGSQGPDAVARPAAEVLAALAPVPTGVAPTIYRTGDADGRVILRARSSAWVHVSSTNNDYLWVKTLQPGDAFVVPDRQGLVLWTGNAGGIEVIVDGAPLPPLGAENRVLRDVSLQPQALLDRLPPAPAAGAASSQ